MAHHRVQQWATFARMWWIYDARWQCPFESSNTLVEYLTGRRKPIYHPLSDVGDHVVVINTKDIAMEGQYWRTYKYFHHTGYPGGFTATRAYEVHQKDPTKIMHRAVKDRLDGNLLRRGILARLHLYPEENVPDEILKNVSNQIRQVMPVPVRLDEYSQEDRAVFPRVVELDKDFIIRTKKRVEDRGKPKEQPPK